VNCDIVSGLRPARVRRVRFDVTDPGNTTENLPEFMSHVFLNARSRVMAKIGLASQYASSDIGLYTTMYSTRRRGLFWSYLRQSARRVAY
jgi:hypothetical protein